MRAILELLLRLHRDERGITGIESAGILTGLVVSGTVLSGVVIDAGTFSAEQTRDTVMQSIERVRGNVELRGMVVATSTSRTMTGITFDITPSAGGRSILVDPGASGSLVINVTTATARATAVPYAVKWLAAGNGDGVLDPDELVEISIPLPLGSDEPCPCTLRAGERFTIEVLVPNGNVLTFERSVPSVVTPVMNLN